jgi:peptide/nickel transport system substrate-binding protein
MLEVSQWLKILQKPYSDDRKAVALQSQHDNNNGDAVFTVFNKYHSDGANSTLNDGKLDKTIKQAETAVGGKRRKLWQQAMKRINDVIVADVPLFHMVGYTRVGKRISYTPSISTNSELHLEEMKFR